VPEGVERQSKTYFKDIFSTILGNDEADASPVMMRLSGHKDLEIRHLGEFELKGLSDQL
jgi:hypothetical protein